MENDQDNQNLNLQQPQSQNTKPTQLTKKQTYVAVAMTLIVIVFGILVYKFNIFKSTKPGFEENQQVTSGQPLEDEKPYPIDEELKAIPNFVALADIYNLNLSPGQQKFLKENKFLLIEDNLGSKWSFDDMLKNFDSIGGSSSKYYREPQNTVLVNPDIVLHTYHKFFEMTLEQLEQKELAQTLNDFLSSLHANLLVASKQSASQTQQRNQNLLAQVTVARVLFENKNSPKPDSFDSPEAENAYNEKDKSADNIDNAKKILAKYSNGLTPDLINKIQIELEGVYKASNIGVSPLFGQYSDSLKTDYTQFTPRSHYTKNSALRAYFRTMMYLGRSSYFMAKDTGIVDTNLLTHQFTLKSQTGITPIDPWQKLMTVTGFYAGQSDDLTYTEWQNFERKILGTSQLTEAELVLQSNVQKMVENLNQVRLPKILSDVIVNENIFAQTKSDLLRDSLSFRIFGQRFTFDAWVLNDLTAGQEQTEVRLPSTPSALFVQAALGDARAKKYSGEFLKKDADFSQEEVTKFYTKLDQKQADIGKVTKTDWFASMGSAWLYVLGSLTHSYDKTYPAYMQSLPYLDKQIQTSLGSYTELKHDTLLYAKQSYAELGGGGAEDPPLPPVVKGFVEPNLDFWHRFNELIAQTKQTFSKNHLFGDSQVSARLQNFEDITNFYALIAEKEMQGKPISEEEYERLRTIGLSFMVKPCDNVTDPDENSGKVPLIADVHTDAVKGQILYEATAKPYWMLAIVDNEKTPRVVIGLVYNHYEFTNPLGGNRLTDEDWKSWVYEQTDKLPAKNFWYDSLQAK